VQSLLLQDLITIRAAGSQGVIQSPTSWLDLGDLEDVAIFTDVRETSGSLQMSIETAAAAQETAFVTLVPSFPVTTGIRTDVVTAYVAKIPPARYLRWHVSAVPGSPGDATFRIWVAAYGWA